jgi:hypothetical protein
MTGPRGAARMGEPVTGYVRPRPPGHLVMARPSVSWHYILTRRENGAAHYEDLLSRLLAATPEQCRTYSY